MLQKQVEGIAVVMMLEMAELMEKDIVPKRVRQTDDVEIEIDVSPCRAASPVGRIMLYGHFVICESVT